MKDYDVSYLHGYINYSKDAKKNKYLCENEVNHMG